MQLQKYMDEMKTMLVKSRRKAPMGWECEKLENVVALGGGRTCVNIRVVWRPSGDGRMVLVVWSSIPP